MNDKGVHSRMRRGGVMSYVPVSLVGLVVLAVLVAAIASNSSSMTSSSTSAKSSGFWHVRYLPQKDLNTAGTAWFEDVAEQWGPDATLAEVARHWENVNERVMRRCDRILQNQDLDPVSRINIYIDQANCCLGWGKPEKAYEILQKCRRNLESQNSPQKAQFLYSLIYLEGLASLRRGENENCIMCRGESSCILPISASAVHKNRSGSEMAIHHFSEYLQEFPDDLGVRWLLNLAHMTLGQYPEKVNPRYLVSIDRFLKSEFDIGRFRDIGHLAGVNRFNRAGGAIMEDFDNDGLLDLALSSYDPQQPLAFFRNTGDGHFEELKEGTGVEGQLGGLMCVQTDYNNDGLMDIFVTRGAWLHRPIRPSLLRNDGGFHFTDVTEEAGLLFPANSISMVWADYDNDGWVDLFVPCERQPSRLYRNLGHGKFEDATSKSKLSRLAPLCAKGAAWIDYDNDDYPDLFVNYLNGPSRLCHNERDGTFKDVTMKAEINGPLIGFSCWAWDYDNDGWMDIFATSFDQTLDEVVKGLMGKPHDLGRSKLYHNRGGESFEDLSAKTGLNMAFATMGSNFADFDNDGYLDMYLGTGDPRISTLVPNRMFKNVAGQRFAEITASAGVGHLQKGHGIACGDWDRDGNVDLFADLGGAVKGDEFHNALFQNPGHDNHWLTLKLVGQKTNRAALGTRIKIVTAGESPLTIHRHVSSGSSFGGNPLEQTIGLGKANRIAELTIHWPTSGTTQTFHDLDVDQAIKITEFAEEIEKLAYKRISVPQAKAESRSTQ